MDRPRPVQVMLIRHAHPRAGYGDDPDPGLDERGRQQAVAMAEIVSLDGPRPISVSPLRRTRETAAALEARWSTTARIEPRVGEIPSPSDALDERTAWLRSVLRGNWSEQAGDLQHWRDSVLDALRELREDSVVVTHFVAINAVVGAAMGDDRVTCCMPDHCSQTIVEVDRGGLALVRLGAQASTEIR
jgi:broad specificity phosphatase PhoE